jgi:WD40 repeat protein
MGVSWLQFADGSPNDDKFLLATVGLDNSLKLWNVQLSSKEGIKLMNTLEGHTAAVYSCQFSYDFKYIVTA